MITGYDAGAIAELRDNELQAGSFIAHGAHGAEHTCGIYDHVYSLDRLSQQRHAAVE